MRSIERFGLLALFALPALLLPACSGLDEIDGASLLAYWNQSPTAIECSDALDCVAFAKSLHDFETQVNQKRAAGMELVRLDAYRKNSKRLYAGAWETVPAGSEPHVYSTALTTSQFVAEQNDLSAIGYRLIHVSVWRDDHHRWIAAIWKPGTPPSSSTTVLPHEKVEVGLSWSTLGPRDAENRRYGFFLDDIEVDPKPPAGVDPFLIAVWRRGTVETAVLPGAACSIATERIEPEVMVEENGSPCKLPASPSDEAIASCAVFDAIRTESASGFHPADFEPYAQDGTQKLAVLLQKRGADDWLMVPGSWHAVHCRHQLLGIDPVLGVAPTEVGLADFDLVGLGAIKILPGTHNGLVHDGGTSGPPGSASTGTGGEPASDLLVDSALSGSPP